MVKRLLSVSALLVLLVTSFTSWADSLISSVDRDRLSVNETLNLSLSYLGSGGQAPDLSVLQHDFIVLGQQQSQRMQINNGSVTREQMWNIVLQPRRVGTLTIPAFEVNGEVSQAIVIEVSDQSSANASGASGSNSKETVYGEADVDVLSPYVQQQVILTWRLISKLNIDGVNMAPPDFGDALSLDLGAKRYQRTGAHGQNEVVIEQRYALFPQKSGELVIPGHYFQAELLNSRGGFFGSTQSVNIPTPAITLQVKPAPNTKAAWLPATQLTIQDQLSTTRVTAGEPFTRQLHLQARGILAEQLPNLQTNAAGVKRYAEPVKRENNFQHNQVISQSISSETLIAEQAGELVLPAISVVWFDISANEWREAQAPAQTIYVEAQAGSTQSLPSNTQQPASVASQTASDTVTNEPAPSATANATTGPSSEHDTTANHPTVLWLLAGGLVASLVLNGYLLLRRPQTERSPADVRPSEPAAKTQYKDVFAQQDARKLYQLLMRDQRSQPNPQRQRLLDELSAHLYQASPADWQRWQELFAQIHAPETSASKATMDNLYG